MGDHLGLRHPLPGLVGHRPREPRPVRHRWPTATFWQDHFELINWPLAPLSRLWPGALWMTLDPGPDGLGRRVGCALPGRRRRPPTAMVGPAPRMDGGGTGHPAAGGQSVDLREHLVRRPLPVGRRRLLRHARLSGDDPGAAPDSWCCGWCCAWHAATSPGPTWPRSASAGSWPAATPGVAVRRSSWPASAGSCFSSVVGGDQGSSLTGHYGYLLPVRATDRWIERDTQHWRVAS